MRLIRPARNTREHRWALALSLAMLLVGAVAIALMALLPPGRPDGVALLGIAAALAIGVGLAWLIRAITSRREAEGDDLARMLSPTFDDNYVLILSPRLPGVPADLAALLVGPAGVRALIARRWRGRYRVRGRGWEYDTRRRTMTWIPCRTNPSFDAAAVADAVSAWARTAIDEASVPIVPTIAFPRSWSRIVLEEPDGEIVMPDNAPWWAQRIGRLQRMDAARVARFVQSVMDASEDAEARAPATQRVA
jgi:hypothetical protein